MEFVIHKMLYLIQNRDIQNSSEKNANSIASTTYSLKHAKSHCLKDAAVFTD